VFTRNRFCAAPVTVAREHIARVPPRALVINSGNANAGTGGRGIRNAEAVCAQAARQLGVTRESVLPFSTGVIGEQLPISSFEAALPRCIESLSSERWLEAARAIMTTDVVPKGVSRKFEVDDAEVTLTGIVKGSGMVRPDMATVLAFVGTDASIRRSLLDELLVRSVERSFNCVTVDGDTSTNDACVLMATGEAGMPVIEDASDPRCAGFSAVLDELMTHLAQSLVRDGEGATKFVTIDVSGAGTEEDAREVAFTVAQSPLVKTALYASDPNWGRILAAVGRAKVEEMDVSKVNLLINDTPILENGEPSASYTEQIGQKAMDPEEIRIVIEVGSGPGAFTVWTTDLSYDYVRINAEYRS
jgi:glutamate N-acetyltransferase/amino-acid N-acetyltransferase